MGRVVRLIESGCGWRKRLTAKIFNTEGTGNHRVTHLVLG